MAITICFNNRDYLYIWSWHHIFNIFS
uniref:Uncharacterized protein n=1 Tax=Arundo donax TaxID=35708 RepID=A0A0A9BXY4_ARUDO